jgi:PAS domain S-box-containing protein
MPLYRTNEKPYPNYDLPMSRAIKGKNVLNEELIIQMHKDDSRIYVSATAVALTGENGEIVGAVGVFEDITERKKAEGDLNKLSEELEEHVQQRTAQTWQS